MAVNTKASATMTVPPWPCTMGLGRSAEAAAKHVGQAAALSTVQQHKEDERQCRGDEEDHGQDKHREFTLSGS